MQVSSTGWQWRPRDRDVETLQVLADEGYYSSEDLKACEDHGIVAYVPPTKATEGSRRGRFPHKDFIYDGATDSYRCPAGEQLHSAKTPSNTSGRVEIRYMGPKATCGNAR